MNREDDAKVGGWLDHASKMARAVEQHNAQETIAALTAERDNALAALRRRSAQRDQLDRRCEELFVQREELTARAERAEAAIERMKAKIREIYTASQVGYGDVADTLLAEFAAALDSTDPEPAPGPVVFLLWSGKWQSWWRPNAAGYTTDQTRAGRYSETDALRHVRDSAMCGILADVTSMVAAPDNWQRTP